MIGDPSLNILDSAQGTLQMLSIQRILESHITTYLLGRTDQWEASASRRILNPAVAYLSNLPPYQGDSIHAFACMVGGLIILSTAAALLLPNGPEVTLSDLAARLKASRVKASFWGNGEPLSAASVSEVRVDVMEGSYDRPIRRSYWENECTLS
jgi:hypothetical protein